MIGEELTEELLELFNTSNSAPFLFVGSGLSRRYLGLEDWAGLLRHLASLTDQAYPYYATKAGSDLPAAASLIAQAFHEIWWKHEKYATERERYGESFTQQSAPLKLQAAHRVQSRTDLSTVSGKHLDELNILRNARVSGIITTNWDNMLEQLFPDFKVFVGQNEALFSQTYAIAEIFKIHGSCEKPETLVLTAEDYKDFNSRNAYLAAKLLTTFLDHPIVFLGYSLVDKNIRSIFDSVVQCLDDERAELLARRLLFVDYNPEPSDPTMVDSVVNLGNRNLRLTIVKANDYTPIYQALAATEHRINAKLLRQIKEHLYELVKTNDPMEKIAVVDVEDLENRQDIEVVVGVGISSRLGDKGFQAVQTEDLFMDLITDGTEFNGRAQDLVNKTLTSLFRGNRKFVPVYKYLGMAGALDQQKRPVRSKIPPSVMENALLDRYDFEVSCYRYKRAQVAGKSLDEVIAIYGDKALPYLTLIDHDVDRLHQYLLGIFPHIQTLNVSAQDYIRKLICIYDRLRFGPGFPVEPSPED